MLRLRLFGIPVTIEPWFWLTAALLNLSAMTSGSPDAINHMAAWIFVVLVSVLWHELGHAVAFIHYGYKPEIVLRAFGGYATAPGAGALPRGKDIIISLAGPAFGFLLWGVIVFLLAQGVIPPLGSLPRGAQLIIAYLLMANLWWSILNLVPIYPLDGGRVLLAAFGPGRVRQALTVTVVVGILFAIYAFFGQNQLYLAVFAGMMSHQNYERLKSLGGARW